LLACAGNPIEPKPGNGTRRDHGHEDEWIAFVFGSLFMVKYPVRKNTLQAERHIRLAGLVVEMGRGERLSCI